MYKYSQMIVYRIHGPLCIIMNKHLCQLSNYFILPNLKRSSVDLGLVKAAPGQISL